MTKQPPQPNQPTNQESQSDSSSEQNPIEQKQSWFKSKQPFKIALVAFFVGVVVATLVMSIIMSRQLKFANSIVPSSEPINRDQIIQTEPTYIEADNQPTDISDWQTYQNEEYGFEFKYPLDLAINDYEEGTMGFKSCKSNNCTKQVVVLKNQAANYRILFRIYKFEKDNYDLCQEERYKEKKLNEIGRGKYQVQKAQEKLYIFDQGLALEKIYKDGQLQSFQSQCFKNDKIIVAVHLVANDLNNFVLFEPDKVVNQVNQILSTFKFLD